jgi:hypothetical protein
MSHHLDTPLAAQNGQLYIDDLYVFSGDQAMKLYALTGKDAREDSATGDLVLQGRTGASTVFIMDVNSNITEIRPCESRSSKDTRYVRVSKSAPSKCTLNS